MRTAWKIFHTRTGGMAPLKRRIYKFMSSVKFIRLQKNEIIGGHINRVVVAQRPTLIFFHCATRRHVASTTENLIVLSDDFDQFFAIWPATIPPFELIYPQNLAPKQEAKPSMMPPRAARMPLFFISKPVQAQCAAGTVPKKKAGNKAQPLIRQWRERGKELENLYKHPRAGQHN